MPLSQGDPPWILAVSDGRRDRSVPEMQEFLAVRATYRTRQAENRYLADMVLEPCDSTRVSFTFGFRYMLYSDEGGVALRAAALNTRIYGSPASLTCDAWSRHL